MTKEEIEFYNKLLLEHLIGQNLTKEEIAKQYKKLKQC
tara:strand:+ start:220 stop:333 length:114 start_codon:yes stop_codon:yes gene_type:complete